MKSNITKKILELTHRKLLLNPNHPLSILRDQVYSYFDKHYPLTFAKNDSFSPYVSIKENFDLLLIPPEHVSRSPSDTYYLDESTVLRTHTTAHDFEMLKTSDAFLMSGDVYRRDEIDRTHYPAFHQLEGGCVWDYKTLNFSSYEQGKNYALDQLKSVLEGLAKEIYGDTEMRWVDAYFPFTEPSLELELKYRGEWLEVLGSGIYQPQVLYNAGRQESCFGWAFGLGLERWAMKLFEIPDIRLFWSENPKFTEQFSRERGIVKFCEYSKYPVCYKDLSFWVSGEFIENDFYEIIREIGGDLVEIVEKIDSFHREGRESVCYRINYRSMDRNLTNEEINDLQFRLREVLTSRMQVELR